MPVAFANFDPNQSQCEEWLAGNAELKTSQTSFATAFALTAVMMGLFWKIITFLLKWRIVALFVG